MLRIGLRVALAAGVLSALASAPATAQSYAPWPPPPGITAGEYAARYGNRGLQPREQRRGPEWQRQYRRSYDPDSTGALRHGGPAWYGRTRPGVPTPPAGMTWQDYESYRAGSGGG